MPPARNAGQTAKSSRTRNTSEFTGSAERVTPQSLEAEQSTLGAMLMSEDTATQHHTITRAAEILRADDFYMERHRIIFTVMIEMFLAEQPVDYVTVAEELRRRGQFEQIGDAEYLTALIYACPSSANIEAYAHVVLEKSLARNVIAQIDLAQRQAYNGVGPLVALDSLGKAMERFDSVAARLSRRAQTYTTDEVLDQKIGAFEWLWPGWIPASEVTLLAARSGSGKSTVAMDLCKRLILGINWPDNSLNNYRPQTGQKTKLLWIDTEAGLGIFRQRLQDWEFPRGHFVFAGGNELEPLRVDNDRDYAWMTQAAADNQPALIVIDSLTYAHEGDENSNDWMKFVMRRISDLAQSARCAVLCIHHLNKIPQGMPDWPMNLDMVRGASAIQQFPRSIIGIGTPSRLDPENHGFVSLKLNIALAPKPLGYRTTQHGPAWGPCIEPPRHRSASESALEFVADFLKNGPRLATDLEDAVREAGICSPRTLVSIRSELGVEWKREGGSSGRTFLSLPGTLHGGAGI